MTMRWECLRVRRQLSRYMDAELSDRSAARIERHLIICRSCQRELDDLVETARFVSEERAVVPPEGVWDRIESRLIRAGVTGYGAAARQGAGAAPLSHRLGLRLALGGAVLGLIGVFGLPRLLPTAAPRAALAHAIDVQELIGELRSHRFDERAGFWNTYRVELTSPAKAARACPAGKPPAPEVPAGFVLDRSMVFQTDCCLGLLLEYTRGDTRVYVVQIPKHHPMDWGTETYVIRTIGMDSFEVHEEPGLRGVVHNGAAINLLVAGDTDSEVLGEVATYLNTRAESALRPTGR